MPLGDFFSANLSRLLQGGPRTRALQAPAGEGKLVWITFALCLICSGVGVGLSFLAFGTVVAGIRMWGVGFAIAVVMLGLTYGAKYANADARRTFTPVDFLQYMSQGFLWPSTWPALADFLGVQSLEPPSTTWLPMLDSLPLACERLLHFLPPALC
jgi:hypothetical protein